MQGRHGQFLAGEAATVAATSAAYRRRNIQTRPRP